MPKKTRNPCCEVEELVGSSIVTKLIELERLQAPNDKSVAWAEDLVYLWINPNNPGALHLERRSLSGLKRQEYIAVSYSWKHTPELESSQAGSYRITNAEGQTIRQSKVRDQALSRIIRYAIYHRVSCFWIDQECIPQDGSEQIQLAMDSMDLVYRNSRYPVGLLAVTLETQDEVDMLEKLLMGRLIQPYQGSYPRLVYAAWKGTSLSVFHVLRRLYQDRWWTRAWIFQEEYLSSTNMHLLIRCKAGVEAKCEFGILPGEMCVNAANFREQATLFLLAFKREIYGKHSKPCTNMLKRFGKYNVQYHFQRDARRKAMSPRIFADIQRRRLDQPFDRLPIAANSCDYALRFASQDVSDRCFSVGLCSLAMFLLNGEVLRNARDIKKLPTEMDLCNYLQYISFNKFDPPVREKHLSYLKECRLYQVSFTRQGVLTRGHLWRLEGTFQTFTWPYPPRRSRKCHNLGLNNFQRDCLFQLLDQLQECITDWQSPANEIKRYLDRDALNIEPSPAKRHMDLMAESVVEAIRTGTPLEIASMEWSNRACGVFVGLEQSRLGVFTSWHAGIDVDGRSRETHVSLGVKVQRTKADPILECVQWVNGLTFFKQDTRRSVVFTWPRSWKQSFTKPQPRDD